jgi:hypothetical protein
MRLNQEKLCSVVETWIDEIHGIFRRIKVEKSF